MSDNSNSSVYSDLSLALMAEISARQHAERDRELSTPPVSHHLNDSSANDIETRVLRRRDNNGNVVEVESFRREVSSDIGETPRTIYCEQESRTTTLNETIRTVEKGLAEVVRKDLDHRRRFDRFLNNARIEKIPIPVSMNGRIADRARGIVCDDDTFYEPIGEPIIDPLSESEYCMSDYVESPTLKYMSVPIDNNIEQQVVFQSNRHESELPTNAIEAFEKLDQRRSIERFASSPSSSQDINDDKVLDFNDEKLMDVYDTDIQSISTSLHSIDSETEDEDAYDSTHQFSGFLEPADNLHHSTENTQSTQQSIIKQQPAEEFDSPLRLQYLDRGEFDLSNSFNFKNNLLVSSTNYPQYMFYGTKSQINILSVGGNFGSTDDLVVASFETKPKYTSDRDIISAVWKHYPHSINLVKMVNFLGKEMLVVCRDDGRVSLYDTETLVQQLQEFLLRKARFEKSRVQQQSLDLLLSIHSFEVKPTFQLRTAKSVWGIDVYEKYDLLAISDNSRRITVFHYSKEHDGGSFYSVISHPLASNVPDISFIKDDENKAEKEEEEDIGDDSPSVPLHTRVLLSAGAIMGELVIFEFVFDRYHGPVNCSIDDHPVIVDDDGIPKDCDTGPDIENVGSASSNEMVRLQWNIMLARSLRNEINNNDNNNNDDGSNYSVGSDSSLGSNEETAKFKRIEFQTPKVVSRILLEEDVWTTRYIDGKYFKEVRSLQELTGDKEINEKFVVEKLATQSRILDTESDPIMTSDLGLSSKTCFFEIPRRDLTKFIIHWKHNYTLYAGEPDTDIEDDESENDDDDSSDDPLSLHQDMLIPTFGKPRKSAAFSNPRRNISLNYNNLKAGAMVTDTFRRVSKFYDDYYLLHQRKLNTKPHKSLNGLDYWEPKVTSLLHNQYLMVTTKSHLGLFHCNRLVCNAASKNLFQSEVSLQNSRNNHALRLNDREFEQANRISFSQLIPELSCVVVASQSGVASLYRLTCFRGIHAFRQEYIFPDPNLVSSQQQGIHASKILSGICVRRVKIEEFDRFYLHLVYNNGAHLSYELYDDDHRNLAMDLII
ncbi:hypothetical protein DASC09_054040 [Saccharomycopsis crataegensis]|uniref:CRT10-like protein n=1 Tax=Saccharomycopsis crataegensis TaxID=43959 RepID=A0AAV5QTM7_9ASCO|nr:hypothetical protein DASC09_054040 [Saccharomycopsis crataegensis]